MIETERLRLRAYTDSDAERLFQILSDERVYPWLDDPPHRPMASPDAARVSIDRWAERTAVDPFDQRWAIEVTDTGVVAGSVLLARMSRKEGGYIGEHEIGWNLAPDSWGHGYAPEAARALLDWAFAEGLDFVWCGMYPHNEASQRVAEKLGLPFIGVQPDPWYQGDSRLYRVTREEWLAR